MSRHGHFGFRGTLLAACVLAAGCGGGGRQVGGGTGSAPAPFGGAGTDEVLLTVHNNDFRDAVVYAVWNGYKDRVGMVTGTKSQTFQMKWKSEWIQVQIAFIGDNEEQLSDRIPVTQGDHLDYVILGRVRGP